MKRVENVLWSIFLLVMVMLIASLIPRTAKAGGADLASDSGSLTPIATPQAGDIDPLNSKRWMHVVSNNSELYYKLPVDRNISVVKFENLTTGEKVTAATVHHYPTVVFSNEDGVFQATTNWSLPTSNEEIGPDFQKENIQDGKGQVFRLYLLGGQVFVELDGPPRVIYTVIPTMKVTQWPDGIEVINGENGRKGITKDNQIKWTE